jgi:hypothetical protein
MSGQDPLVLGESNQLTAIVPATIQLRFTLKPKRLSLRVLDIQASHAFLWQGGIQFLIEDEFPLSQK